MCVCVSVWMRPTYGLTNDANEFCTKHNCSVISDCCCTRRSAARRRRSRRHFDLSISETYNLTSNWIEGTKLKVKRNTKKTLQRVEGSSKVVIGSGSISHVFWLPRERILSSSKTKKQRNLLSFRGWKFRQQKKRRKLFEMLNKSRLILFSVKKKAFCDEN